jgi:hypothetical protein
MSEDGKRQLLARHMNLHELHLIIVEVNNLIAGK